MKQLLKGVVRYSVRSIARLFWGLVGLLEVLAFSKRIRLSYAKNQTVLVVGNGPSLNKQLSSQLNFFLEHDLICVNAFAISPWYDVIKPRYYILVDPFYYLESDAIQKLSSPYRDEVSTVIDSLATRTQWNMTLFLLYSAKNAWISRKINHVNGNVQIVYLNNVPMRGSSSLERYFMQNGWMVPRLQNVLIGAIYVSLLMRYKKIYLLGAENNLMNSLKVSNDNVLYYADFKHFYEKDAEMTPLVRADGTRYCMKDYMEALYYVFKGYEDMQLFANKIGTKIVNLTPESFIDAFPKQDLEEGNVF